MEVSRIRARILKPEVSDTATQSACATAAECLWKMRANILNADDSQGRIRAQSLVYLRIESFQFQPILSSTSVTFAPTFQHI